MKLCETTNPPIHPRAKAWALALWWALWKSINAFIFRGIRIKLLSTIICVRKMIVESMAKPKKINQGPLCPYEEVSLRSPTGMARVFLDASFRAVDGKTGLGFAIFVDGVWVHAGSCEGPKISSPIEDEVRAILCKLKEASIQGFHC